MGELDQVSLVIGTRDVHEVADVSGHGLRGRRTRKNTREHLIDVNDLVLDDGPQRLATMSRARRNDD
jgi:hypothetical protein